LYVRTTVNIPSGFIPVVTHKTHDKDSSIIRVSLPYNAVPTTEVMKRRMEYDRETARGGASESNKRKRIQKLQQTS
jgi:hypothetical protein